MSENGGRRDPQSPLVSERGNTVIDGSVVSQLAGLAAGEVEGVYLGGSYSRAGGRFLGMSSGPSRGVSVEVGRIEVALDVTMGLDYGLNIIETSTEVRRGIVERVESLTGLRVSELNITISDIVFPDQQETLPATEEASPTEESPEPGEEATEMETSDAQDESPESGQDESRVR